MANTPKKFRPPRELYPWQNPANRTEEWLITTLNDALRALEDIKIETAAISLSGSAEGDTLVADSELVFRPQKYVPFTFGVGTDLTVSGNASVSGDAAVDGNVTVTGNINVSGAAAITGNASFGSNVSITGTVTATGNALFKGTTGVEGALTATGAANLLGDINHDGDNIGFYAQPPTGRGPAITQTYATTGTTIDAYTPDDESGAYTGLAGGEGGTPYAAVNDLNALRVAYESLRALTEDLAAVLNRCIDFFQLRGDLQ